MSSFVDNSQNSYSQPLVQDNLGMSSTDDLGCYDQPLPVPPPTLQRPKQLPSSTEVEQKVREKNSKRCKSRRSKWAKIAGMALMGVGSGMAAAGTGMFLAGIPLTLLYGSGVGLSMAGLAVGLGGAAMMAVGGLLASSAKDANGDSAMSGADWKQSLVPGLGVAKAVWQGVSVGVGDYNKSKSPFGSDSYSPMSYPYGQPYNLKPETPSYHHRSDQYGNTSIYDDTTPYYSTPVPANQYPPPSYGMPQPYGYPGQPSGGPDGQLLSSHEIDDVIEEF